MIVLRSLAFHTGFYVWTVLICSILAPTLPLSRRCALFVAECWSAGTLMLLHRLAGCRYHIKGFENLPQEPVIIACKHQSAWETTAFHTLLKNPVFVLKKALVDIPLYGWYIRKLKMIAVDRNAGLSAMRDLILQGERALREERRHVIIFPEGTRLPPGQTGDYHPGVAALYAKANTSVVPVALNSGLFWPRRGFLIQPGFITIEFLPPIAPGLERSAFMPLLVERIEQASQKLLG